jgi:hypothetical protein
MLQQVTCMAENRNAHIISVGKPEGNISLGRPKRRWEYDIKTKFKCLHQMQEIYLRSQDTLRSAGQLNLCTWRKVIE